MTPDQQTAATDNALLEKLVMVQPGIPFKTADRLVNPNGPEAAERIKSLLAELAVSKREAAYMRTKAISNARERNAAEADRQRMREALEKLMKHMRLMQSQCAQYVEPTGYTAFDRKRIAFSTDREAKDGLFIGDMIWLLDGPEQRAVDALARAALNPASKEANDARLTER